MWALKHSNELSHLDELLNQLNAAGKNEQKSFVHYYN